MQLSERALKIGTKLRALRLERALTQDELAAEAGVHPVTISDLERDEHGVSARTLKRLAKALDVEVRELTRREPLFPGGATSEEHQDAVLDHEEEERRRRAEGTDEGENGPEGGNP